MTDQEAATVYAATQSLAIFGGNSVLGNLSDIATAYLAGVAAERQACRAIAKSEADRLWAISLSSEGSNAVTQRRVEAEIIELAIAARGG